MNRERRRSRRFQPAQGRDSSVFIYKGRKHPAVVLNVSAEGFGISLQSGIKIKAGDEARLDSNDGRHIVRVANAHEEAGKVVLGLQRLDDLPSQMPGQSLSHAGRAKRSVWLQFFLYLAVFLLIGASILVATMGVGGVKHLFQRFGH